MPYDLDSVTWPVHSPRLIIRLATPADAEATWSYRRLPSVDRWMATRSSTLEEHRRKFDDPDRLAKTLIIERSGVVIGDLMLAIEDGWAQSDAKDQVRRVQAELGWCLSPDYTGHGYATEAVAELVRICFQDLDLRRVRADCFADNEPSWRLMERLHLRRELHTVRDSWYRSGQWLDGFGYALLAEEWRALQHEQ